MRLPSANRAAIDAAKLENYLLSPDHPVGRFKARVFATAGYTRANVAVLQADLLDLAQAGDAEPQARGIFGQKFIVRGILQGPNGERLAVATVWIIRAGEEMPRFVTAYPGAAT